MSQDIKKMLVEDMAFWDVEPKPVKITQYMQMLGNITVEQFHQSRMFFRSQPGRRQMPMPADYLQAVPDGHPTANESWAIMPKSDDVSVVWTEEMRQAFAIVAPLVSQGNLTSAFFAYKEAYEKAVSESRMKGLKPKWSPSFGFSISGREGALVEAIEKNRISLGYALKYLPELEYSPKFDSLILKHGSKAQQIEHGNNKYGGNVLQMIEQRKK